MKTLLTFALLLRISFSCIESNSDHDKLAQEKVPPIDKSLALKPPMGWNSWNCLGRGATEAEVRSAAEYMAKNLKHLGYEYIVKKNQIILAKKELLIPVILEQVKVMGLVSDDRGELLPGANILVEGTNIGTIANNKGEFTLNVPGSDSWLIVSFIGFITDTVEVGNSMRLDIMLSPDVLKLDEVTVTPLGILRRNKALTYASQKISPNEIVLDNDPDMVNSLQGKIIRAVIKQGSGGFGSATTLVLRGNRSLTGNSAALFVVDGIPKVNFNESINLSDFGNGYTGINGTSTLNPNDIESITVLRGASASALYG